jgi:hypothetical protein
LDEGGVEWCGVWRKRREERRRSAEEAEASGDAAGWGGRRRRWRRRVFASAVFSSWLPIYLARKADSCSPSPTIHYTDLILGPALCPLPNHGTIILPCLPCLLHPLASTFSRRPHGRVVCGLLTWPSLSPPWPYHSIPDSGHSASDNHSCSALSLALLTRLSLHCLAPRRAPETLHPLSHYVAEPAESAAPGRLPHLGPVTRIGA